MGFCLISAVKPVIMSSLTLTEMIYALSKIEYRYEYHPQSCHDAGASGGHPTQGHLQLLNQLALLLVTKAKSDVAAVSLRDVENSRILLGYSKNRPFTNPETKYIGDLRLIAADPTTTRGRKYNDLFDLVLQKCQKKITSWLRGICRRLGELGEKRNFGIKGLGSDEEDEIESYATWCDSYIRKVVGENIFPLTCSLPSFLKRWFKGLLSAMSDSSEFQYWEGERLVYHNIVIAYWIARDLEAHKLLDSSLLLLIGKLGDYCGAIIALVDKMVLLGRDACGRISMVEVGRMLDSLFRVEENLKLMLTRIMVN